MHPSILEKPFTQQNDILRFFKQTKGLCKPLSNLYAASHLKKEPPSFLASNKIAYEKAVQEENKQLMQQQLGKEDTRHSAFIESGLPHVDMEVNKIDLTTKEGMDKLLDESVTHCLVSYPTENQSAHMVYYGKDKLDQCYFFDPDKLGGEFKGPCNNIRFFMRQSLERSWDDKEDRKALVGIMRAKP